MAFTLVELLVAMVVLIIVTMSTMLVFRSVTQAWRSGQMKTERYQQARLLFDLFARELSSCVANPRYPFLGTDAGAGQSVKEGTTRDELFFVGALPGRAGLIERGYWVNDQGRLMCHDEEPADGDYSATGADEVCGADVKGFEATYFDGAEWVDDWDGRTGGAQAGQVPKAVRIVLTIGKPKGEAFETVIYIPTS